MTWIHQVATEFGLSKASFEKNSLADTELSMLYRVVMNDTVKGVDNMQQHYIVWMLSWVTAARSRTLAVCPGECCPHYTSCN
jgi:hypothetical protein